MSGFNNIKLIVFDFDGVFTNNLVYINEDGKESVVCNRSDGIGLSMLRKIGIEMIILSTEKNPVVKQRANKLLLECHHGVENKLEYLKTISRDKKIPFQCIAYLGNDINDLECLKAVGLAVVVADAYSEVKQVAKIILSKKGGDGAVREFCEMIYKSKKKILNERVI